MKQETRWGQSRLRWSLTGLLVCGALSAGSLTVTSFAQAPAKPSGGLMYAAPRQVYTETGIRLEGTATDPAHLWNPGQLDVKARTIAFDFTLKPFALTGIRANNNVSFDLKRPASGSSAASHINATSDAATLSPAAKDGTRTLTLTGKVNGFYEVGNARNTLSGSKATITLGTGGNRSFNVAIEGGAEGFRLEVPAQSLAIAPGETSNLDTILITGDRATLDQNAGTVRIIGKARAEGKDKNGATSGNFLVTATEFVLTRDAAGQMNTLTTVGRTRMKVDLPPSPTAATVTAVEAPATGGNAPNGGTTKTPAAYKGPGMPTAMEAEADKATVTFKDKKLVFEGNVQGQYELRAADGTATRYPFNGDKIVVRTLTQPEGDAPAGLNVVATGLPGSPVTVQIPDIGLGLD